MAKMASQGAKTSKAEPFHCRSYWGEGTKIVKWNAKKMSVLRFILSYTLASLLRFPSLQFGIFHLAFHFAQFRASFEPVLTSFERGFDL
jgi:hypothetical protein